MVYNSGAGGITSVRIETGNLLPADFPDAEITLNLENAYSTVQLATGRILLTPFISTDTEFGTARELEKKIAARDSLKPYSGDAEIRAKVEDLHTEITEGLAFLKENATTTGGDTQILFAVTPYLSTGAILDENPEIEDDGIPYRSGLTDSV